jgi:tRNA threonylcarbamoyladenosine biosynthesis protein TsaB
MIDARRMEVYTAFFSKSKEPVTDVEAVILSQDYFDPWTKEHRLIICGDGSSKCREILPQADNVVYIDGVFPSAKFMVPIGQRKFSGEEFEDLAYFEPFYLKEFIAGKPRVKGLND